MSGLLRVLGISSTAEVTVNSGRLKGVRRPDGSYTFKGTLYVCETFPEVWDKEKKIG